MSTGNASSLATSGAAGLAKMAVSFAPVPGLLPALQLAGAIAILCENVKANRYDSFWTSRLLFRTFNFVLGPQHVSSVIGARKCWKPSGTSRVCGHPGNLKRLFARLRCALLSQDFLLRRLTHHTSRLLTLIHERMTQWKEQGRLSAFLNQIQIANDIKQSNSDIDRLAERILVILMILSVSVRMTNHRTRLPPI
jgi:hypothetical protein